MSERKPFAFVLMPFRRSFEEIYQSGIRAACEEVQVVCQRVDEQIYQETILERIVNQIRSADLVIAEMTGGSSNVFYEVGFAHALRKRVILLTQRAEDIPFDLMPFPHVVYEGDVAKLKSELVRRIPVVLSQKDVQAFGDEVQTAPRPDVRLKVQNGLLGYDLRTATPMLGMTAQNHSPVDMYLGNFLLRLRGGGVSIPSQDAATGRHQVRIVLKPGEAHTFHVSGEALFENATPEDYAVAVVRDELDREYETTEAELAEALAIVFRDVQRRRDQRATRQGG